MLRGELSVKEEDENQTHLGCSEKLEPALIHCTPCGQLWTKITFYQHLTIPLLPHFPSIRCSLHSEGTIREKETGLHFSSASIAAPISAC